MKINHNIPALEAFNMLNKNQSAINKSLQRLSSGKRINSAADDAAGMAISQKMDTQIRGLSIASRNASDGISVIQTAEGALNEVHSMLQRIRELAVQASNGTLQNSDRSAIQDEIGQLKTEINRIGDTTEFNTVKLLNGDIDMRSSSTDSSIANLKYVSDAVQPGNYNMIVTQAGRQEVVKGSAIPAPPAPATGPTAGTIYINNERLDITNGESFSDAFGAMRDLCDKVGISLISTNNPPSAGATLTLINKSYGTNSPIKIEGDLNTLTSLGISASQQTKIAGQDIAINGSLLDASHGFLPGTTVVCNGNEIDISNSNDFSIKLTGATQTLYTDFAEANAAGKQIGDVKASAIPITTAITGATGVNILGATGLNPAGHSVNIVANVAAASTATQVGGVAADTLAFDGGAANGDFATNVKVKVLNTPTSATGPNTVYDTASNTITVTLATSQANNTAANIQTAIQQMPSADNIDFSKFTVTGAGNWASGGTGILASTVTAGGTTVTLTGGKSSTIDGIDVMPAVTSGAGLKTYTLSNGSTVTADFGTITYPATGTFNLNGKAVGVQVLSTGPMNLQIGANAYETLAVRVGDIRTTAMGIDDVNVYTAANAESAISTIDTAINYVSRFRGKLGAYQNRLEHTTANLDTANENMTAAMSRIEDTDMAQEMSEYTKDNILIQAGNSMLAQANQLPNGILKLLQG